MEPFVTHRGRLAVLDWTDVNTDLIIPARYLKKIERTGFGPLLFADKRYAPGGAPEAQQPCLEKQPGDLEQMRIAEWNQCARSNEHDRQSRCSSFEQPGAALHDQVQ